MGKLIVDSIHGDIRLTDEERGVIDTASFQRLRSLKQLGMGQVTYPGATHTRFAHSIGVLGIMARVTDIAREALGLKDDQVKNIRLAGLLHDIGHYPYSHLMEVIDNVILTEDFVGSDPKTLDASKDKYQDHEEIGELIVTQQGDILAALGGEQRAKQIADLFRRNETADPQLSKLIHSSLDMDRLDYLIRDTKAAGVPYGQIDLNYLINSLRVSKSGVIGVERKAITALEHFALARFFMHKAVYFHKTTFGIEEACRQLLRRCKNAASHGVPISSREVREIVTGEALGTFTDAFVDRIIQNATADRDECIRSLAQSIQNRRTPKLVKQVVELGAEDGKGRLFKSECKHQLSELAARLGIHVGRFLYATTKPLAVEKRGGRLDVRAARDLESEERDELMKVFIGENDEPISLVDVPETLLHHLGSQRWFAHRLYIVDNGNPELVVRAREAVAKWDT
ncbi:MAG: HD domain-containing protein [Pirellulaceae bacterium]|nr:HD domain-containing protein [Planctomycetales bacterium]MCA9206752.1 HD domain-containing protein [Planctomycetales bacterium]